MGDALWDCWVLRSGRRRSSQVHPVWIWPANPALLQVVVEDIDVDIDNGDGDSCDPPLPMHALKKVFYLILQHSGWGMVGPASRRANAWLVSSSRLSPTARCRCLFFCKADFSNAMPTWPIWYFGLFLWVNDNTVLCRSYGRLKLNFLCKRFSPCIYSFCSIDLIYMKPNTSDSPYM